MDLRIIEHSGYVDGLFPDEGVTMTTAKTKEEKVRLIERLSREAIECTLCDENDEVGAFFRKLGFNF